MEPTGMGGRTKVAETPPWVPFEDRRRARDEKREAVLRMAVRLFLTEGYHRTTLNEVAARLNITKPALYNYFRSKDEILIECYRIGQATYDAFIEGIERDGGTGLDKLRRLIRAYVRAITSEFGMCVTRLDDRELSDEARAEVRRAKRGYDTAFRTCIEAGIADGSIVACDPKLTAFAIAGSLNWIGHWFEPEGALSADTIADEFAIRLTEGVAKT
jgi:AcrR family transcriptional regulator